MPSSSEQNLLFGVIALQMNFVRRDQLVAATSTWLTDKSRQIDEILVEQGALNEEDRQLLAPLVARHLENHDGDVARSFAALSSIGSVADDLRSLGDEQIEATLSAADSGPSQFESLARDIFFGAIDTPTADLDAYLEGRCRDDAELRAAVERLMASHKALGDFQISGQTVAPTVGHESSPPSSAAGDLGPASGSRFRVLRPHAKGGLGEVSVAKDVELNRDVALKEIQERFADDEASRSRFLLEAEVTGGLEHPGIVPVYGLGRYDDGRPFYAMRFIKGDSLQEAAEQMHGAGPVDFNSVEFRKLLGRFIDVCEAIEYAHSRGVLHRDLKPGNIMLGKYGETLVVDWGLAKLNGRDDVAEVGDEHTLRPSSGSGAAQTQMGSAIGTPAYMPPEQAAGNLDELGPASDVYSLGATLFYLLTGQRPFQGTTHSVLEDVKEGRLRSPRSVLSTVPKPLEAICLRAMSAAPKGRYASPVELAEDVEQYLADEPVGVYSEPVSIRVRRWLRKHQTVAATSTAVVLLTVVGLTIFSSVISRTNSELSQLNSQLDSRNLELNNANTDLIVSNQRADNEAKLARAAEERARRERDRAEGALYLSDIRLASQYSRHDQEAETFERLLAHLPVGAEIDRRGWEWHYLLGRTAPSLLTWAASPFNVAAVSWSADGELIATVDYGGTVAIWNAETGERVFSNRDGGTLKTALDWHPTEQLLAWGCAVSDPHIRVYDVKAKKLWLLAGNMGSHRAVRWSPSGDRLAVGAIKIKGMTKAATLGVWKRTDERWRRVAERRIPYGLGVDCVDWSPNGASLLVVGRTVRTWLVDPESLEIYKGSNEPGYLCAAWHPTAPLVACGTHNGSVHILDTENKKVLRVRAKFNAHLASVTSVAWSPDGESLATASADHSVKVWDGEQYELVGRYLGHNSVVNKVCWRADSERLASCDDEGQVNVWPRRRTSTALGRESPLSFAAKPRPGGGLSSNHGFTWVDGETIRISDSPDAYADYDVRTGEVKTRQSLPPGGWRMLSASLAGRRDSIGKVGAIIDVTAEAPEEVTIRRAYEVWADDHVKDFVAFRLGSTREFFIRQLSSDRESPLGDEPLERIKEITWAPNRQWLAVVGGGVPSDGGTNRYAGWTNLFDAKTGATLSRVRIGDSRITGAAGAWSPDSSQFVAGNLDGLCQVYSAPELETQLARRQHRLLVRSLSWHPTEPRIASSSADGSVKVWDAETGDVFLNFPVPSTVGQVAWSPDGLRLGAIDGAGHILVWSSEAGQRLAQGGTLRRRLNEQLQSDIYSALTARDYETAMAQGERILALGEALTWKNYYLTALLALEVDQRAVAKATISKMFDAYGESPEIRPAYQAAWAAVLSPTAMDNYAPVVENARRLLESDPEQRQLRVLLAAAILRAGQPDEARIQLDLAAKAAKRTEGSPAFLPYFRALTEFRLKRPKLAKRYKAEGDRLYDEEIATSPPLTRKFCLNILRREATELDFSAVGDEAAAR